MARSRKTTSGRPGDSVPDTASAVPELEDERLGPAEPDDAVPLEEPLRDAGSYQDRIVPPDPLDAAALPPEPEPETSLARAEPETEPAEEPYGLAEAGEVSPAAEAADDEPPGAPASGRADPPPPSGGSGFLGGLIGGAVATAAGFSLLWVLFPDVLMDRQPPPIAPLVEDMDAQAQRTDALAAELAALRGEFETLAAAPPPETPADDGRVEALQAEVGERIEAVDSAVAGLSAAIDVLEGRLAQVEARPPVVEAGDAEAAAAEAVSEMRAALEAQRAEIATLADEARARLEAAETETAALQEQAAQAARSAVARAALSRLQAAMDAGSPYAGALSDLTGATETPIPEPLVAAADTGVPTLAELQRTFPEAARAALSVAIRSEVGENDGALGRIGAFLRAQTGARSTAPREGSDADAVLSRAEAAVAEGRLADALDLVATLPAPAQEALSEWRGRAEARLAAVEAAERLSSALSES